MLGIQDSTFRVGFWTIFAAVVVLLLEPAVWTLVGGLSQFFLVSIVVMGAFALIAAFLGENLPNHARPLRGLSIALLSVLSLFVGYAFIFHYHPTPVNASQGNNTKDNHGVITHEQSGGTDIGTQINNYSMPSSSPSPTVQNQAIHVRVDSVMTVMEFKPSTTLPGMFVVSEHTITPVDVFAFVTIANSQNIPMKIENFWWDEDQSGTELCPISVANGGLYSVAPGGANRRMPFSIDNSLQLELSAKSIPPHESVSGWTFWGCPVKWCFPYGIFGVEDAEGNRFTTYPDMKVYTTQSVKTVPLNFRPMGNPVSTERFKALAIQKCGPTF
jgi:hypothetical protein